jgi:hypothetical protein
VNPERFGLIPNKRARLTSGETRSRRLRATSSVDNEVFNHRRTCGELSQAEILASTLVLIVFESLFLLPVAFLSVASLGAGDAGLGFNRPVAARSISALIRRMQDLSFSRLLKCPQQI